MLPSTGFAIAGTMLLMLAVMNLIPLAVGCGGASCLRYGRYDGDNDDDSGNDDSSMY